jgi:hypothetical protein
MKFMEDSMKRITMAFAIMVLLIFSCAKKEESQAPADVMSGENSEHYELASGWEDGYVLRVDSAFYTLENDTGSESDRTKWNASMTLGEKVSVGEIRRKTFHGDGVVYDFVEVRRDNGSEGLGWALQVAKGGSLAVVIDERANLFRSPRAVDVSGTILPRGTLVVYYPETERDGFVEVRAYDPAAQIYVRSNNNNIRLASLSRRNADIQSSILLQTALPLKDTGTEKNRKDALLDTAMRDFSDSVFSADIQALANPKPAAVIETEPADHRFLVVNDNNVNVRDIPDPAAGKVVGQLKAGDVVPVIEQTKTASVIGGQSALWYRITEPLAGWVFGAYLEPERIRDE